MYLGGHRDTGTGNGNRKQGHTGMTGRRMVWSATGVRQLKRRRLDGVFIIIFIHLYLDGILGVIYWGVYIIDGNAYISRYSRTKT